MRKTGPCLRGVAEIPRPSTVYPAISGGLCVLVVSRGDGVLVIPVKVVAGSGNDLGASGVEVEDIKSCVWCSLSLCF
jgi:hypothetical protein